jgi:hypothetical protein
MAQHKWHKEIHAFAEGEEIQFREIGNDTWHDDDDPEWCDPTFEFRVKPQTFVKCIVKDCMNHTNEGAFVGDLCAPCWDYITNGNGVHSQAYRNAHPKEPQYLYAYEDLQWDLYSYKLSRRKGEFGTYIGKIKLEDEDV